MIEKIETESQKEQKELQKEYSIYSRRYNNKERRTILLNNQFYSISLRYHSYESNYISFERLIDSEKIEIIKKLNEDECSNLEKAVISALNHHEIPSTTP